MASDDVIELGSSDEDNAEPAAKKRKPMPNAMVRIPGKQPVGVGMTISQAKSSKGRINPASLLKSGSGLTIRKVTTGSNLLKVNPLAATKLVNRNAQKRQSHMQPPNHNQLQGKNIVRMSPAALHVQDMRNRSNGNILKRRVVGDTVQGKPLIGNKLSNVLKKSPLSNTKLPPGITVTRTSPPTRKPIKHTGVRVVTMSSLGPNQAKATAGVRFNSISHNQNNQSEVPTVELEDDDPPQSSGPQWYLRPEQVEVSLEEDTKAEDDQPSNTEQDKFGEETEENCAESQMTQESTNFEKQNNKEPSKSKYLEITIEDSPIKPTPSNKGFQVGPELAITIDDSPVRSKSSKTQSIHSDDETSGSTKERSSKKKLKYPVTDIQVVEIEFEQNVTNKTTGNESGSENNKSDEKSPDENSQERDNSTTEVPVAKAKEKRHKDKSPNDKETTKKFTENTKEKSKSVSPINADKGKKESEKTKEKSKSVIECIDIVEIEESPIKPEEESNNTTPKKNIKLKPSYKMDKAIEIIDLDEKDLKDFNATYRSFIKLCLQLENSDDMKKIVEKKIKAYYRQVPKEYTNSDEFIDMVGSKIMAMKAAPEKMYLYIKDIVDELNLERKNAKAQPVKEKNEEQESFLYSKESEFDSKRQRQIRKLEKTLKKLHRAIQKLEEEEVDFDDEEDSVYLLTERYKERSARVHAKLCQLTNTKMPSEARLVIDPRPGQPKGPAKRLEKWINRKVPIGTPLPFPDFHDVLRCVRDANREDDIGWNEADVMEEARDLFVRCGRKLQRRRQENEWRLAASRVPSDASDPVEEDPELKRKLEENRRLASRKETDVFNKFADRQKQLKLEAVEIGDKEAEESPVESDDEAEEDVVEMSDSATDKQKRKEKLKSILQKSKVSDDNFDKVQQDDKRSSDRSPEDDSSKENADKNGNSDECSRNNVESSKKDNNEPESSTSNYSKNVDDAYKSDDNGSSRDGENNLLQRRYSVSINSSSDSESPIAIDTSSDENDEAECQKQSSDVISIENSSLSELDENKDEAESEEKEAVATNDALEKIDEEAIEEASILKEKSNIAEDMAVNISTELASVKDKKKTGIKICEESRELFEDVLLASSDEGDDTHTVDHVPGTCINLRDDLISIGDTMIVDSRVIDGSENSKSDQNTDSSSIEGMEIGPTELISKESRLETATEESEILDKEAQHTPEKSQTNNEPQTEGNTNVENSEISEVHAEKTKYIEDISETICLSSVESVDGGLSIQIEDETVQNPEDIDSQNKTDKDHSEEDNIKDTNETSAQAKDLKDPNENDTNNIEQVTLIQHDEDATHKKIQEINSTDTKETTDNDIESMEQDQPHNEQKEDTSDKIIDDINTATEIQDTPSELETVCENTSQTKENNTTEPCELMEVD